jgi:protein TonB
MLKNTERLLEAVAVHPKSVSGDSGGTIKRPFGLRIWHTGAVVLLLLACPSWADTPTNQQEWAANVKLALARNLGPPVNFKDVDKDQLVRLRMTVLRDGSVKNVTVERSSGHREVDQAAIAMVNRTGRLPSFTADMKDPEIEIVLPVTIMVAKHATPKVAPAEASGRHYSHPGTGFTLDVPFPYEIVRPRKASNYDVLVDVVSLLSSPPVAGTSKALCGVGFKASPQNAGLSQDMIDAPDAIQARIDAMRKVQSILQSRIEETRMFDQHGAKGIEFVIAPGLGPDHESARQYISLLDLPRGRISVSCATRLDAMPKALDEFRAIRDGATLK